MIINNRGSGTAIICLHLFQDRNNIKDNNIITIIHP